MSVNDLTVTNPTMVGLDFEAVPWGELLGDPSLGRYEPHPLGSLRARQAVAAMSEYVAERLVLTVSTSEAYALLFKLVCDPGDTVLVPQPSYPLFEHLARLEGVNVLGYPLRYVGGWQIDLPHLRQRMGPTVRAVVVVSPNNPTGQYASRAELEALQELLADDRRILIVDEVFRAYPFRDRPSGPSAARLSQCLTFGLGGLSKLCGLPQMKLGWIGLGGPAPLVEAARNKLEFVADTYLSVGAPVQVAAEGLLVLGARRRGLLLERVRRNRRQLSQLIDEVNPACTLLAAEGGWSAVVQLPAIDSESDLVVRLLEQRHVLVHPGYFYDFSREAFVVLSLLPPPHDFEVGVRALLETVLGLQ